MLFVCSAVIFVEKNKHVIMKLVLPKKKIVKKHLEIRGGEGGKKVREVLHHKCTYFPAYPCFRMCIELIGLLKLNFSIRFRIHSWIKTLHTMSKMKKRQDNYGGNKRTI